MSPMRRSTIRSLTGNAYLAMAKAARFWLCWERSLDCGYAALPIGNDVENNLVYVWPALAEADLTKLTPQQEVALYRLVSPDQVKTMREAKRWQWWRLAIGADGTWHAFHKAE